MSASPARLSSLQNILWNLNTFCVCPELSFCIALASVDIVSLVPSWTETLIWANLKVVGRTRYCIHPKDLVQKIRIVGGTKKIDYKLLAELKPDYLVLDKEENSKEIAEKSSAPFLATHITHLTDLSTELKKMAETFGSEKLLELAGRWHQVAEKKSASFQDRAMEEFPGLIQWVHTPDDGFVPRKVVYVVWRNPWMCIRSNTFIGSVLQHFGFEIWEPKTNQSSRYPEFHLEEALKEGACILLSSEPYDFLKKKVEVEFPRASVALVDGENFSWFGLRSLEFLEGQMKF